MSKRPPKKKFTVIDVVRVARKLQEEKDGKRIISDSSATAHLEIVPGFEEQYLGQKSEAGSRIKRNDLIWQATLEILEKNPKATPREVWEILDMVELPFGWALETADEKIFLRYEGLDPKIKNPASISFSAFRTGYVYKVRTKLGITVE